MNRQILSVLIIFMICMGCVSHLTISKEDFFYGEIDEGEYILILKDSSQIHVHTPKINIQNESLIAEGIYKSSENAKWIYFKDTVYMKDIEFIEYPRHISTGTPTTQIVYAAVLVAWLVISYIN